jgi:hypothetical protein
MFNLQQDAIGGGLTAGGVGEEGCGRGNKLTVEVGHDQHVKLCRVLDQLHAGVVDDHLLVLYVGVVLRLLPAAFYEQTICHLQTASFLLNSKSRHISMPCPCLSNHILMGVRWGSNLKIPLMQPANSVILFNFWT